MAILNSQNCWNILPDFYLFDSYIVPGWVDILLFYDTLPGTHKELIAHRY